MLPKSGEQISLSALCLSITDGDHQAPPRAESGVPFITISTMNDGTVDLSRATRFVPPAYVASLGTSRRPLRGDILYSVTGSIGIPALVNTDAAFVFQRHIAILRPDPSRCDSRWLAYLLAAPQVRSQAAEVATGTAQLTIPLSGLRSFYVPRLKLHEQRRIVAKLDALTARLARARAELERGQTRGASFRQAVLRAAVTGVLTGDWRLSEPTCEPVAQLLARVPVPQQGRGGREATDKIIPGRSGLAVNDPQRSLPAGWQWVSLLRLAKQETGHTPSRTRPSYWNGGVPWIGIRDAGAHHGRRINKTMQTISDEGLANSSARLLPAGTVCLSRTASVGYVTMMARSMATSQDFATWTCGPALVPEYLMYALMAEGDDIRKFGMGSTHTTIYFPEIRALHIALPPLAEQHEIVAQVRVAFARADRLEAEAARAKALLDRLEAAFLAKAFRGELVPQDPADEPASVLLDRIRAERAAAPTARPGRRIAPTTVGISLGRGDY